MDDSEKYEAFAQALKNTPSSLKRKWSELRWLKRIELGYTVVYLSAILGTAAYYNKGLKPVDVQNYPLVAAEKQLVSDLEKKVELKELASGNKLLEKYTVSNEQLNEIRAKPEYVSQKTEFDAKSKDVKDRQMNLIDVSLFGMYGFWMISGLVGWRRENLEEKARDEFMTFEYKTREEIFWGKK